MFWETALKTINELLLKILFWPQQFKTLEYGTCASNFWSSKNVTCDLILCSIGGSNGGMLIDSISLQGYFVTAIAFDMDLLFF